jgi:hypothetical protein
MNKTIPLPVLYSIPVVQTMTLPARAELLPKIQSGEVEYLDFRANVFTNGLNRNPYQFREEDLAAFATSFEGQPFLRDHETDEIDARDGTILSSMYDGNAFVQDIRITTRRGMADYLEGRIDRFSIGWFYDECVCSICNCGFFSSTCNHIPGGKYQTLAGEQTCSLIFVNPKGKEVSAVNVPAVEGTGIVAQLKELKNEFLGNETITELSDNGQEPVETVTPAPNYMQAHLARVETQKSFNLQGDQAMNKRELL